VFGAVCVCVCLNVNVQEIELALAQPLESAVLADIFVKLLSFLTRRKVR